MEFNWKITMREIKFRGKRLNNKWVYGDLIHSGTDTIAILESGAPCLEAVTDVVPESVGQFTGLHDKNGKEIYEGDIVRYDTGGECEVSYCIGGGFAGFDLSPAFHDEHQLTDVEVIGNIHDYDKLP